MKYKQNLVLALAFLAFTLVGCGGGGGGGDSAPSTQPGTAPPPGTGAVGSIDNPAPLNMTATIGEALAPLVLDGFNLGGQVSNTSTGTVTAGVNAGARMAISQAVTQGLCSNGGTYNIEKVGFSSFNSIPANSYIDRSYINCEFFAFGPIDGFIWDGQSRVTWITDGILPPPPRQKIIEVEIKLVNFSTRYPKKGTADSTNGVFNNRQEYNDFSTETLRDTTSSPEFTIVSSGPTGTSTLKLKKFTSVESKFAFPATPGTRFEEAVATDVDLSARIALPLQPAGIDANTFFLLKIRTLEKVRYLGISRADTSCPIGGVVVLEGASGSKVRYTVVEVNENAIPVKSSWLVEIDANGDGLYESRKTYACGAFL